MKILKNTWLRFGAAFALISLLAGCADLALKKPQVEVVSISAGRTTLLRQDFAVVLRVSNPNSRDLNAKGLAFELSSGDKLLATGASEQPIAIPAQGNGNITLTVHASMVDALGLVRQALDQGATSVPYHVKGTLDGLNGWGSIPFSTDGSWKLPH